MLSYFQMEHHANIVPWQLICKQIGATIEVIPTLPEGNLDMEALEKLLRSDRSKILSIYSTSNTLGTVNPILEITQLAHRNNTL